MILSNEAHTNTSYRKVEQLRERERTLNQLIESDPYSFLN